MIVRTSITVSSVSRACGGRVLAGDHSEIIRTITSDSRELGPQALFVPLAGDRFDGHDFIPDLAESGGIRGFLTIREELGGIAAEKGLFAVLCGDTLKALGAVALWHRGTMDFPFVGITGTNGKTTTKELAARILGSSFTVLKNEKNYNNEIGVPFTLLGATREHRIAVIEMGMNHSGELARLGRIVRPDLALITNVGQGHLEFLGTVENVARAKAEIMEGMAPGSTVIVNRETRCFEILRDKADQAGLVMKTFGISAGADYSPESYRLGGEGLELEFRGATIRAPLYGVHNLYNVTAALAVADHFGISPERAAGALEGFENVEGRSQVIEGEWTVINDTYNSNPMSLKFALESIREIYPDRRKIAVLSDMKELGESGPGLHRESGELAAGYGFDFIFLWGEMADAYAEGALSRGMGDGRVRTFPDKESLSSELGRLLRKGDVVLVKGSRSMKMEDVVNLITRSR